MLRRLLIAFLVILLAAVVVVDRVGERVAAHVLAGKLQSDEHLSSRPSVTISGIPFLTQAFGGDYHDVSVTAHNFRTTDGVTLSTLTAHLHGVHIPFSKVLGGSVKRVPVDRVDGSAFISFAGAASYFASQNITVTLSRASSHSVQVTMKIPVGHRLKLVQGIANITVGNSVVTLTVSSFAAPVLSIPFRALPFRFRVTSVTVTPAGITGTGTANHVVLGS